MLNCIFHHCKTHFFLVNIFRLILFFIFISFYSKTFANDINFNSTIQKPKSYLSKESAACISCHKERSSGLYQQWGRSKHFGANVGCYECHGTDSKAIDAIRHKDFFISVIVSPKKCSECHSTEVEQFNKSHHAKGVEILGSLDNVLAEVIEGHSTFNGQSPVAVSGCWQCHGSVIKVLPNGTLDPTTWPNTGIGRINPDGSRGACTACHQRHEFSLVQARHPETCGKCHLGPDHPQKEIYDESKHGINFYSQLNRMNLESSKWVAGEDYDAAPTCATCHMSATKELPITHDVGDRISWTLRPAISEKIDAKLSIMGEKVKSWIERRNEMKTVCKACHEDNIIGGFYEQFDNLVSLYNEKFAKPGNELMVALTKNELITNVPFDHKIKFIWFELWHHQGRRARHGASMQAPDYTQWHGMYEVARSFYSELIPEIKELIEQAKMKGNIKGARAVKLVLEEILNRAEHRWFIGKMSEEEKTLRKISQKKFKERYLEDEKQA